MNILRTILRSGLYLALGLISLNSYAGEADIVSVKQLSKEYGFRYDGSRPINLSGIGTHGGGVFIVGDNKSARHLYKVQETATHWRIVSRIDLNFPDGARIDLEGMFNSAHGLFLVNEYSELEPVYLYEFDGGRANIKPLAIKFPDRFDADSWGNAGLEGVAYDVASQSLFLAKERDPARIFVFRLSPSDGSTRFLRSFRITPPAGDPDNGSYSDLYFENGFLYLLERQSYSVAKIDPVSQKVVARVSFTRLRDGGEVLYKGDRGYGTAEALLLAPEQLLIGIDNNGKRVNKRNRWVRYFNLKGDQPAIVRLTRPEGF